MGRELGQSGQATLDQALVILQQGGDVHRRMHALLEEATQRTPEAAAQRCAEVARMAQDIEFADVAMKATLMQAQALHQAQQSTAAAALLRECVPRLAEQQPAAMYLPQAWWTAAQVFDACGDTGSAITTLAQGNRWILDIALPRVPEVFRDSFLQRNATNRAMLAAAGQRLDGGWTAAELTRSCHTSAGLSGHREIVRPIDLR